MFESADACVNKAPGSMTVGLETSHLVVKHINDVDTSKMMYLQHFSYISAGA